MNMLLDSPEGTPLTVDDFFQTDQMFETDQTDQTDQTGVAIVDSATSDLIGKALDSACPPIYEKFSSDATAVLYHGDCLAGMKTIPDGAMNLIVSSPPYNIGKTYEKKTNIQTYLDSFEPVIDEMVRVLSPTGSLCWQVGNFVDKGAIIPLDVLFYPLFAKQGLKLRNRIVWQYQHGLHMSKRFSGRYETILWFTKSDDYTFNLDPVRVPSKYPGALAHKGPRKGLPSGNPLGKNPSDIWEILERDWDRCVWDIPNVKANHPEKTAHPCSYPIEMIERLVLSMTNEDDWVLDPYAGVSSALLAALKNGRRAMGCEMLGEYVDLSKSRVSDLYAGTLGYRTIGKSTFKPNDKRKIIPASWGDKQMNVTYAKQSLSV